MFRKKETGDKLYNLAIKDIYNIGITNLKKEGFFLIPAYNDIREYVIPKIAKKFKTLEMTDFSKDRILIVNPKKFKKRKYKFNIELIDSTNLSSSIPPIGYITIYVENTDYVLVIINFLKKYAERISIDSAIDLPIDILNKMCNETLTEDDKLLIFINNPNIIFPEDLNGN